MHGRAESPVKRGVCRVEFRCKDGATNGPRRQCIAKLRRRALRPQLLYRPLSPVESTKGDTTTPMQTPLNSPKPLPNPLPPPFQAIPSRLRLKRASVQSAASSPEALLCPSRAGGGDSIDNPKMAVECHLGAALFQCIRH